MSDDYQQSPPNPSQAAPTSPTAASDDAVGEPAAQPRSMWLGMLVLLLVVAAIFLVVFLFSNASDRAPLPAQPPRSEVPGRATP